MHSISATYVTHHTPHNRNHCTRKEFTEETYMRAGETKTAKELAYNKNFLERDTIVNKDTPSDSINGGRTILEIFNAANDRQMKSSTTTHESTYISRSQYRRTGTVDIRNSREERYDNNRITSDNPFEDYTYQRRDAEDAEEDRESLVSVATHITPFSPKGNPDSRRNETTRGADPETTEPETRGEG